MAPFFDEEAYARLYERGVGRRMADTVRGFWRRFRQIPDPHDADAVLIHREIAPLFGAPLLRALRHGPPILFDLDDAVFLPQPGGNPWLRLLRDPEADTVALVRSASICLAGNAYLAEFVRRMGGQAIVLPTTVDTDAFRPATVAPPPGSPVRVSWVGTHSTQGYLSMVVPALQALAAERAVEVTVVSNRPPAGLGAVPVRGVRWALRDEVSYFQGADIGLYPVPDDPWTRGKCGGKAVQYLACGVPLVGSPVGVLEEMIRDGVTGFIARNDAEWLDALRRLSRDGELRRRLGAAGRALVEDRYSLRHGADVLADAIRHAVEVKR